MQQRGADRERPAGAHGGGAQQHWAGGYGDGRVEADDALEMRDHRAAGQLIADGVAIPTEQIEERQPAHARDVLRKRDVGLHLHCVGGRRDHRDGALRPDLRPSAQYLDGAGEQLGGDGAVAGALERE